MGLLQRLGLGSPKAETNNPDRQATDYTTLSIAELENNARYGDASLLSASLAAMGLVSRAFSLAEVSPANNRTAGLTSQILGLIGAGLVLRGEAALYPMAMQGEVSLIPAQLIDVDGGPDPRTWFYHVELFGPGYHENMVIPGAGVVHVRLPDPIRPWRGQSPLPRSAATLAQAAEQSLLKELRLPVARVTEVGGEDSNTEAMKAGLRAGGVSVLRASSLSQDEKESPKRFEPAKFSPAPDSQVAQIRKMTLAEVFGAVGLSVGLFSESSSGSREAWRQTYRNALLPLARLAQSELASKLGVPDLRLDLSRLGAADIQMQASAYRRLAGSAEGSDIDSDEARRLTGLGRD